MRRPRHRVVRAHATLSRALSDLCLHAEGADWAEIAAKLSRYGGWEYEDYPAAGS
jgi:Immunity protein 8